MSASNVKNWAATAAGNNTGSSPDYPPEGWAPSEVNDWAREAMAQLRLQFEDEGWFNWGHTITWVDADNFRVTGDLSAIYRVGRRVRAEGATTGIIYGDITTVVVATDTTVTVSWDSGALVSETLEVSLGFSEKVVTLTEALLLDTARTFTKTQASSTRESSNTSDGTSITWDMQAHQTLHHTIDSAANVNIDMSNPVKGASYRLVLDRTTTGFGAIVGFSGGTTKQGDNQVVEDITAAYTILHFYALSATEVIYEGVENYT